MTDQQPTQPWYTTTWVVILALWLFFPVGLYLMWRFTRWEVWVKTIVSVVYSLVLILVIVSVALGRAETDDDEVAARDVTPSPTVDVEATETASASVAVTATAAAKEDEEVAATATAEALAADAAATAEALAPAETASAEALELAATATAEAEVRPTATPTPEPEGNVVLAANIAGGWLNIDFIWRDDALQEAKECVQSHLDAEAVACFAFASQAAYKASEPESAGNFTGPLCWDARWQRNKVGGESGGEPWSKDPACPD